MTNAGGSKTSVLCFHRRYWITTSEFYSKVTSDTTSLKHTQRVQKACPPTFAQELPLYYYPVDQDQHSVSSQDHLHRVESATLSRVLGPPSLPVVIFIRYTTVDARACSCPKADGKGRCNLVHLFPEWVRANRRGTQTIITQRDADRPAGK